jgi:hypothetical protein
VSLLNLLHVLFRDIIAGNWVLEEESVVHITSGVRLGLEEGVKVPETTLNELVSGHLIETHLKQGLSELGANLQERVQMTASGDLACSVEVSLLKLNVLPGASAQHISSQLRL